MHGPGYEREPEHRVDISPIRKRVEIFMDREKVVDTVDALQVDESGHDPVLYIPKEDLRNVELIKTSREYKCPFKGEANFFTIKHGHFRHENAVWAYDKPFDEVAQLKGRVAFYPKEIDYVRITG